MSNSFSLGRSEFTQIAPGTPIPIQVGGSFGRIKSVAMDNMCLDIEPEQPYPVDRECKEIKNDLSHIDQAWHISPNNYVKFLDIKHELTEDFFMCLYAFGDKEDGTGFVRARDCPGKGSSSSDEEVNAQWEILYNPDDPLQYRLKNVEIDMCLGEEVTQVKAGKAGRPGPARTRTTWQLLDCTKAPWWKFLHLFESRDLDDKLCKVAQDPDACFRYKNANRSVPAGLGFGFGANGQEMSADYAQPFGQARRLTPEEEEYYEAYMASLRASYEYYLDPSFDPYDYTGY